VAPDAIPPFQRQQESDRHLYAWDVEHNRPVRVAPGPLDELRARCHDSLVVCQFDGCEAAITPVVQHVRAGARVRAHFRHPRIDGVAVHAPESIRHFTGKWLVRDWLHLKHPDWEVEVERRIGDTDEHRQPDVMVKTGEGLNLAIEVQFSPLNRETWTARSLFLAKSGYVPVWLWGRPSCYFTCQRTSDGAPAMPVLHERVSTSWKLSSFPIWIDPDEETFLFLDAERLGDTGAQPYSVLTNSISECCIMIEQRRISAGPWRRRLPPQAWLETRNCRRALRTISPDQVRLSEDMERWEAEAEVAREVARQRRLAFEQADEIADVRGRMAAYLALWEESPLRATVVRRFDRVPEVISRPTPKDQEGYFHPEEWRAKLVMGLLQGKVGKGYEFMKFVRPLYREPRDFRRFYDPVREFLRFLKSEGYVAFNEDRAGRIVDSPGVRILADLDTPRAERLAGRQRGWLRR
jgi:hypothetical protein